MAGQVPQRAQVPFQCGGPLNEAQTPSQVGSLGLTACENLLYRRHGSWGKRPGVDQVNTIGAGPYPNAPSSGVRWYRAFPTPLKQTVVAHSGALWTSPGAGTPASPGALSQIATFQHANALPVSFASMRDPAINSGNGGDILVLAGASALGVSFATGAFTFSGTVAAGQVIALTMTPVGGSAVTVTYTTLATDSLGSVATNLTDLINASAAVTVGTPFMSQAIATEPTLNGPSEILMAALVGGVGGNGIALSSSVTGTSGLTVTPGAASALTGGGQPSSAPLKYDGSTVTALSPFITNQFTGCVYWHNHLWFWGDPQNPDTLFASDINQPEGWTFMTQNGGYDVGVGDGDPAIITCIPIGNILYIFKPNSVYAMTGYDFQSGEYEFSIAPALFDTGTPYATCAVLLKNAIIFWNGTEFQRLVPGAFEAESLSTAIPFTCGKISAGNQSLMRSAAGSFNVLSALGTTYEGTYPGADTMLLDNFAYFACDTGDGAADTIVVYDHEASKLMGFPAWATWSGWTTRAWIPFGASQGDTPMLFFISAASASNANIIISQFGYNATSDYGRAISWLAQTGWIDLGTPMLTKDLHEPYLDVEALAGAQFGLTIVAAGPTNGTAAYVPPPVTIAFPATVGQGGNETAQVLESNTNPALRGFKFLFIFTETSVASAFELLGGLVDAVTNPFTP